MSPHRGRPLRVRLRELAARPFAGLEFLSLWRWSILSVAVGVVVGLGACAFYYVLELGEAWVLGGLGSFHPPSAAGEARHVLAPAVNVSWWMVVLPGAGALASGVLCAWLAPEASGHGTDAMIDAYHNRLGRISLRVPFVKALASLFTIATGGSAGREGPMSQIGAAFGSTVAQTLGLSERERRLLLLAGAAGGIAALFRTPLGASLWALEVLYRDDFESEGMFPCLISSVTAYSIFITVFGEGHLFATEAHYAFLPAQLPLYALMGVSLGALGLLWIRVFWGTEHFFRSLLLPSWLKPVLGGLGLGFLALAVPQVLGVGYGWVQEALYPAGKGHGLLPLGWTGAALLLGFVLAKMVGTSLTVGSGGSGGIFGPSIVLGGLAGGAFGLAAQALLPHVVPQPGAFVLVGMGSFYAGVAHTPLAALVLVCELCGSYDLLVPLMTAIMTAYLLLHRHTLYKMQVPTALQSPAHAGDFTIDILEELRVGDFVDATLGTRSIPQHMTLRQFLDHVSRTGEWFFVVSGPDGLPRGTLSLGNVRELLSEAHVMDVVVVGDAMAPFLSVSPQQTLRQAHAAIQRAGGGALPVVDPAEPGRILGLITERRVIAAYNAELLRRRVGRPEGVRLARGETVSPPGADAGPGSD